MDKIIKEINEFIKKKYSVVNYKDCYVQFSSDGYELIKISSNNFQEINEIKSNKQIAFIDGGNQEIIDSPDFSLNLIRVYYNIFKDNKKIKSKKFEFFALIYVDDVDGELWFKTKIFDKNKTSLLNEEIINFSSNDKTLKTGSLSVEINKIPSIVRRFSEIKLAQKLTNELEKGDIIVLDGNLEGFITNEKEMLDELYDSAVSNGVIVCAISKKCSLKTNDGIAVTTVLKSMEPYKIWNYNRIVEITNPSHKAEIYFIKLHKKSNFIFRFEIYNKQKESVGEVFSLLLSNSKDPIFLGYPYGLIDADKFARVSNNEKEYYKTIFLSKIKNLIDSDKDAHSILDNISF